MSNVDCFILNRAEKAEFLLLVQDDIGKSVVKIYELYTRASDVPAMLMMRINDVIMSCWVNRILFLLKQDFFKFQIMFVFLTTVLLSQIIL